jgi:hypothetical protein
MINVRHDITLGRTVTSRVFLALMRALGGAHAHGCNDHRGHHLVKSGDRRSTTHDARRVVTHDGLPVLAKPVNTGRLDGTVQRAAATAGPAPMPERHAAAERALRAVVRGRKTTYTSVWTVTVNGKPRSTPWSQ